MKNVNSVQGMTSRPAHVERANALGHVKSVKRVCAYTILAMLSAYAVQLMNSAGDIGFQEKNLTIVASALTLLVAVPIIALNIYFVSRRSAPNTSAKSLPRGSHPIKKELVAWAAPIAIVVLLAFLGWGATHSLDLYKPIESKATQERVATVANA